MTFEKVKSQFYCRQKLLPIRAFSHGMSGNVRIGHRAGQKNMEKWKTSLWRQVYKDKTSHVTDSGHNFREFYEGGDFFRGQWFTHTRSTRIPQNDRFCLHGSFSLTRRGLNAESAHTWNSVAIFRKSFVVALRPRRGAASASLARSVLKRRRWWTQWWTTTNSLLREEYDRRWCEDKEKGVREGKTEETNTTRTPTPERSLRTNDRLRYICYFRFSSLLFQTPLLLFHSSAVLLFLSLNSPAISPSHFRRRTNELHTETNY